jgi:hypothetical protein
MAFPGSGLTVILSFDAEGGDWLRWCAWFTLEAPDYSFFEAAGMSA